MDYEFSNYIQKLLLFTLQDLICYIEHRRVNIVDQEVCHNLDPVINRWLKPAKKKRNALKYHKDFMLEWKGVPVPCPTPGMAITFLLPNLLPQIQIASGSTPELGIQALENVLDLSIHWYKLLDLEMTLPTMFQVTGWSKRGELQYQTFCSKAIVNFVAQLENKPHERRVQTKKRLIFSNTILGYKAFQDAPLNLMDMDLFLDHLSPPPNTFYPPIDQDPFSLPLRSHPRISSCNKQLPEYINCLTSTLKQFMGRAKILNLFLHQLEYLPAPAMDTLKKCHGIRKNGTFQEAGMCAEVGTIPIASKESQGSLMVLAKKSAEGTSKTSPMCVNCTLASAAVSLWRGYETLRLAWWDIRNASYKELD